MRPIDADNLSKSINEGPGTPIQKFFADACIAAAPTLENYAPVIYGQWIEERYETISKSNRIIKNIKNYCSICHKSNGRNKTHYCPNCGAKMKYEKC